MCREVVREPLRAVTDAIDEHPMSPLIHGTRPVGMF